jgi:uncharacterized protein
VLGSCCGCGNQPIEKRAEDHLERYGDLGLALEDKMSERIRHLLARLRESLEEAYGSRLRGLFLFGSFARGHEDPESDVDVIIVLDRIDAYGSEVALTSMMISTLSLDSGLSISRVFVSQQDWTDRDSPFLANVREEAIAA